MQPELVDIVVTAYIAPDALGRKLGELLGGSRADRGRGPGIEKN